MKGGDVEANQGAKNANAMRNKILDSADAAICKACCAVVGFCLKEAIVSSISGSGGVRNDSGSSKGEALSMWARLPSIAAYAILVAVAVGMKLLINRKLMCLTVSEVRKKTLTTMVAGLDLIPAWAFKDCVAIQIAGSAPVLAAVLVLLGATVFAVAVDPSPLPEGELLDWQWDAVYQLRKTLAGCMGLGVGFASHSIPQTLWRSYGLQWFQISVMLVYPPVLTLFVVLMAIALDVLMGWHRYGHSHFLMTFVAFAKTGGNFWAAWAWEGLLDTLRVMVIKLDPSMRCLTQSALDGGWAFLVLGLAISVTSLGQYAAADDAGGSKVARIHKDIENLLIIVGGMCTCWAFLDCFIRLYKCVGGPLDAYPVLGAWLFAIIAAVLATAACMALAVSVERLKR